MAIITARYWECDVCGYRWAYTEGRIPEQCRSKDCRSRKWNSGRGVEGHAQNANSGDGKSTEISLAATLPVTRHANASPVTHREQVSIPAAPTKSAGCASCGGLFGLHQKGCKQR